jgi:hypothetical protein
MNTTIRIRRHKSAIRNPAIDNCSYRVRGGASLFTSLSETSNFEFDLVSEISDIADISAQLSNVSLIWLLQSTTLAILEENFLGWMSFNNR